MAEFNYKELTFAITGASGALGKSLIKRLKIEGAYVIALKHSDYFNPQGKNLIPENNIYDEIVYWECGKEYKLKELFLEVDVLILNHGVNLNGVQNNKFFIDSIEVNAISYVRLIDTFEMVKTSNKFKNKKQICEIWVNTSESEVLPSLSLSYELSKRLIGQIISYKKFKLNEIGIQNIRIKKLILGSFKSALNPIGIMDPFEVSEKIIDQAPFKDLIIISPFFLSYILIPLNEFNRKVYYKFIKYLNLLLRNKKI